MSGPEAGPRTWSAFSSTGSRAGRCFPGMPLLVMDASWPGDGRRSGLGVSEADRLADQNDMDAAGQFLVDLQDLPDLAVLPVGGDRAGVFKHQAVPVDPLTRGLEGGDELVRPGDEDDVGGTPGVGGKLAARR